MSTPSPATSSSAHGTSPLPCLWLRCEEKPQEARTLLTPATAGALLDAGFDVVVEESRERAFGIEQYRERGCRIAACGSWRDAAPEDAIILGLKELGADRGPFSRRHVHFAHVFKEQSGWQSVLRQFRDDGGVLYDLEYLVDDKGRRVAAFGYWAGFVGAALGVQAVARRRVLTDASDILAALTPWSSREALIADTRVMLEEAGRTLKVVNSHDDIGPLRALVFGAHGRSGKGACECLEQLGVEVTPWDIDETRAGGPFDEVLDHDLVVNCVFVDSPLPPFTTLEHLDVAARQTAVVVDVSCDPHGHYNPLPIYCRETTLQNPSRRLLDAGESSPPLDLVAIDHLPALLPVESSEAFAAELLPYLLTVGQADAPVWQGARDVFEANLAKLDP